MTQIYMFEFFVDQLIFTDELEDPEIEVQVKAGNLIDFSIIVVKNKLNKADLIRSRFYTGGKSIFFPTTSEALTAAFEKNLQTVFVKISTKAEQGRAKIVWGDKFHDDAKELSNNVKYIREINQFDVFHNGKKVGTIDINMILICYGETIEVSVTSNANSTITIPLLIPKYGSSRLQTRKRSTTVDDVWRPLFTSPYKQKRSQLNVDLMIYAQMAGISTDEQIEDRRLTAEYVNGHICGHKECPGAIKFRDWGIGPLAPAGSGLGTIGAIQDSKPCGKYGMSQAYGTMSSYGAYGLLVDKGKKTKSKCDSPNCPFTNGVNDDAKYEEKVGTCCDINKNKLIKCTCKCCGKNKMKKVISSCEDPKCPSVIKKAECRGPLCPHTVPDSFTKSSNCDSPDCPYASPKPATCEGEVCPYNEKHRDKCCISKDCPTVNPKPKRLSAGMDKIEECLSRIPDCPHVSPNPVSFEGEKCTYNEKNRDKCCISNGYPTINPKPKHLSAGMDKIEECLRKIPDCPYVSPNLTSFKGEKFPYNEKNRDKCCISKDCATVNPKPKRLSAGMDKIEESLRRIPDCPYVSSKPVSFKGEKCIYNEKNRDKYCVNKNCPTVTPKPKRLSAGMNKIEDSLQRTRNWVFSAPIHKHRPGPCCNKIKRQFGGADKENCDDKDNCNDTCPYTGSFIYEYGLASTSNWRAESNLPNSCTDPNCTFLHTSGAVEDSDATESSWGKPKRGSKSSDNKRLSIIDYVQAPSARKTSAKNQDLIVSKVVGACPDESCFYDASHICDDKECQVFKSDGDAIQKKTTFDVTKANDKEAKIQRLSLLVTEAGQKMLVAGTSLNGAPSIDSKIIMENLFSTKQLLSDVISFDDDDDDMIYLIARLLAQREMTTSLNNLYIDDYFNDCKIKDRNEDASRFLNEDGQKIKPRPTGPCKPDTCKVQKYKTCSECGGVSRSGATCDNSDVSFSNISYSDENSYTKTVPTKTTTSKEKDPEIENVTHKPEIQKQPKEKSGKPVKKPTVVVNPQQPKRVDINRKKQKRICRFIYHCGEAYPGIRQGHKTCRVLEKPGKNVPAYMGWLWSNKPDGITRRRKNWRPGMINTTINERIIAYRKKRGIPDPPELKMILPKLKSKKHVHSGDADDDESDEDITPKPTLIIQKKDGNYLITVNPLKDPKTLAKNENPYMTCKPMKFIIIKPKPPPKPPAISKRSQMGEGEGEGEDSFYGSFYKDCFCNKDEDLISESSSSESELNIEFTTPAGLIYPEEMRRSPNVIHTETQFKEADFNCTDCPTILPRKYNKKMKGKHGKNVKIKA